MPTQIDALNCNKQFLGTGLVDCLLRKGKITSVIKVKPGWSFDPATETFDLAYVVSKVQDGTFAPFLNTLDFLNNTPESITKEYADHSIAVVSNGKPQRSLEFDNGIYWHKAAASYSGFRNGGVIEIDNNGTVWLQRNVAGTKLTAYDTNMFNVPTYTDAFNDETAKTFIMYQVRNEVAWTNQMTAITQEQIGADLNDELKGFNNTIVTGTATPALITVNVTAMGNTSYGIEALTEESFRVRNITTGLIVPIDTVTAVPGNPGKYTIDPTTNITATNIIVVELYDAIAEQPMALLGDNLLYYGQSANITVTA